MINSYTCKIQLLLLDNQHIAINVPKGQSIGSISDNLKEAQAESRHITFLGAEVPSFSQLGCISEGKIIILRLRKLIPNVTLFLFYH